MNELVIKEWAQEGELSSGIQTLLADSSDKLEVNMDHSPATGAALVSNGKLGADLIRLEKGDGFVPHTHPGDHILMVLSGRGTITYDGRVYPTFPGKIYMIDGSVPHAVGAIDDHMIVAVGSPHMPVDSPDRMVPVEYKKVVAEVGNLHCLVCDTIAQYPARLHDEGCSHCPCSICNPKEHH